MQKRDNFTGWKNQMMVMKHVSFLAGTYEVRGTFSESNANQVDAKIMNNANSNPQPQDIKLIFEKLGN